ncbi:MAG TPA: SDR family oxidoreductase [Robiginitalea sp.]|nr:SDR family oxidoreductase [Robiginitalea sp.]
MDAPKVVLITGASSGLGLAQGRLLASRGYRVYGTARNPQNYPEFDAFPLLSLDVRDDASVAGAVSELVAREGRIDVLVNNAGMGITGPLEELPHAESLLTLETNFHGPLRVMRAVLPHMRHQGGGLIVNVTSIAGYMGLPFRGMYSAGKAALHVASEAYRMEVRSFGISVCTLAPGDYATNIASGRYHSPLREGSPYQDSYGRSLSLMDAHVDRGGDPAQVARKLLQIVRSRSPKVHYTVGSPLQRFSVVLKKCLPDKIYERLLRNHYKL